MRRMATAEAALQKMRDICLALPETDEATHFGKASFRVSGRMFVTCGDEIVLQLESEHADALVKSDPRFERYPRAKDCVSIDVTAIRKWDEIKALVRESYDL